MAEEAEVIGTLGEWDGPPDGVQIRLITVGERVLRAQMRFAPDPDNVLDFPGDCWEHILAGIRNGEFDLPEGTEDT